MSRYDLLLAFKDKVVSIYPEGNDSNSHCLIGSFLAKRKLCRTIKLSVDRDFYIMGESKPNYPVPATAINACIAAPYEEIMPITKAWLFRYLKDYH